MKVDSVGCLNDNECGDLIYTSIKNEINTNSDSVLIFPNPTNSILNIDCQQEVKFIQILTMFGDIVHEQKIQFENKKKTSIKCEFLPEGPYLLKIQLKNNKFYVAKFYKVN